jgi:hypothetical protein
MVIMITTLAIVYDQLMSQFWMDFIKAEKNEHVEQKEILKGKDQKNKEKPNRVAVNL